MTAVDAFRSAVEGRDHAGMLAACSEDVVLHSPVTFHPFEGKLAVGLLFSILLRTFEDFRYVDEFHDGDGSTVLVFDTRVGNREVEGVDLIRYDDAGLIRDLTVMVRPLSAAIALAEAVGPQLAAAEQGAPAK